MVDPTQLAHLLEVSKANESATGLSNLDERERNTRTRTMTKEQPGIVEGRSDDGQLLGSTTPEMIEAARRLAESVVIEEVPIMNKVSDIPGVVEQLKGTRPRIKVYIALVEFMLDDPDDTIDDISPLMEKRLNKLVTVDSFRVLTDM